MTAETATSGGAWEDAVCRATAVAEPERPGGMDEDCWDDVATRDIIAVAFYALHQGHETPVDEVPWLTVPWWLGYDEHVITLVGDTLSDAGQVPTTPDDELADPFLVRWDGFPLDRVRWPATPGVSEVTDKRYSFETAWRLAT
ncbi:hypothetical protein OG232_04570 [Streptomyces sp. NBC_01411]|uniref:hypothetical protein n=1 Tax=Streptomyces sp. NBC_01411 TaxID=2903857 RepID=UPI00324DAFD5